MTNEKLKYYYDCPIEAAYMAKNFGLRITAELPLRYNKLEVLKRIYNISFGGDEMELSYSEVIDKSDGSKFYLHLSSVKLLEPQESDVIISYDNRAFAQDVYAGGKEACARAQAHERDAIYEMWFARFEEILKRPNHEIVQRNNKPFIMPKTES